MIWMANFPKLWLKLAYFFDFISQIPHVMSKLTLSSVRSFRDKKGNNSRSSEPISLKFCGIICESNCQRYIWLLNFSSSEKTIKSSSEDGGNFINKN